MTEGDGGREVLLMRTWNDGEAALVRHILEQCEIPCRVASDVPHAVLPLSVDGLGEVRVMVPANRRDEAIELLAEQRRQGLALVDDAETSGAPGTAEEQRS